MVYPAAERIQDLFRIEHALEEWLDDLQQERQETLYQASRLLLPAAIETDPGSNSETDNTAAPGLQHPCGRQSRNVVTQPRSRRLFRRRAPRCPDELAG